MWGGGKNTLALNVQGVGFLTRERFVCSRAGARSGVAVEQGDQAKEGFRGICKASVEAETRRACFQMYVFRCDQ